MKPKVDTIVQFSGLKPGKYEYDYTLDNTFFEEFDNDELREGSVDFRVVLDKKERMLMFTFSFSGIVKSICDRCLGELDVPVEGENTLCVKFSDTETSDNEDVVILPETAYKIDLAQWMYEYVVVSLPMHRVHPEGECDAEMLKYITEESDEEPESEGNGSEIDPRWSALKELLEK